MAWTARIVTSASERFPEPLANLGAAMRLVRQHRGLGSADVAARLEVSLRTYQALERGEGLLRIDLLVRFAEITDCDLQALLATLGLMAPEFALRSADNKAMSVIMNAVRQLDADLGPSLAKAETAVLIAHFGRACADLAAEVRRRADLVSRYLCQPPGRRHGLSDRQVTCLHWVRLGKSSPDIGTILGISDRTVNEHLARACRTLGVATRIQAVDEAVRRRILPP